MNAQMIRVISSPSSSTIGFSTLIFAIAGLASYSAMRGRSRRGALAAAAMAAAASLCGPVQADAQADLCLSADPPPVTAAAQPLRFGITPQLAGTAGGAQGEVAQEDPAKALDALHALEPPRRTLVMRLNRLFMSDGQAGIDRFVELAEHYRREGFEVESQIRYHPSPEQEGDMAAWEQFVREAAAALGRNPAVVALTITNEVNLPISANTSDGAYAGALDAIVRGVVAARAELDAMKRTDVELGFSYAYRWLPDQDIAFWDGIGQRATPEFLAALDHVGVQLYPGLFWPPAFSPGQTAGDATIEALTLVRNCWMPRAGLGGDVGIWVTERLRDQPQPHARAPGSRPHVVGREGPRVLRDAERHRLPLLQPARQQLRRRRPLRRRRAAVTTSTRQSPRSRRIASWSSGSESTTPTRRPVSYACACVCAAATAICVRRSAERTAGCWTACCSSSAATGLRATAARRSGASSTPASSAARRDGESWRSSCSRMDSASA